MLGEEIRIQSDVQFIRQEGKMVTANRNHDLIVEEVEL